MMDSDDSIIISVIYNYTNTNIKIKSTDTIMDVINKICYGLLLKCAEDYIFIYVNKNLKFINQQSNFLKVQNSYRLNKDKSETGRINNSRSSLYETAIVVERKSIVSLDYNTSCVLNNSNNNICKMLYSNLHTEEILSYKNKYNFFYDRIDEFCYFNAFNLKLSEHRNLLDNLKVLKYKKNQFINLMRFPNYKIRIDKLSITEENITEIEILKFIIYIKNYWNVRILNINLKYLSYINHLDDMQIFSKLEELNIFTTENKVYSTFEHINNLTIHLTPGKFHNLKNLFLENADILVLDSILYSSRNVERLHLKNLQDINSIRSLKNFKSLKNLKIIILEFKEISWLYNYLEVFSVIISDLNIKLLLLAIKIDSIDLDLGFSLKKLENFKIIQNSKRLKLDLNCILSDYLNKPIVLKNVFEILEKIKIRPYTEFYINNLNNLLIENDFSPLNSLILENVEITDESEIKGFIEKMVSKAPNLNKIKINKKLYLNKHYIRLSKGLNMVDDKYNKNSFYPMIILNSGCLTINFIKINEDNCSSIISFLNYLFNFEMRIIYKLEIEDLTLDNSSSIEILKFISLNSFKLREIKMRNFYLNSQSIELLKLIYYNNRKTLISVKFIKIHFNNSLEELENFFSWLLSSKEFSSLSELKFSNLNLWDKINHIVCNCTYLKQIEKISFCSLKNFTFLENVLNYGVMGNLKLISIKNVETKLEDLLGFFIFYNNQLRSIKLDLDFNVLNLFISIKFANLVELKVLDNLFKYTQVQKENILNALESFYLKNLPFNFKSTSKDLKTSINKKFKFINI